MATSTTRRAIRIKAPGNIQIESDVPAPRLRPDYVIAEAKAWALNPTDIGHVDRLGGPGTIVGCDWSGVITADGENVTRFKPGDAVSGVCHGGITFQHSSMIYSMLYTNSSQETR
jgi:NADPH:quinone reductase-like Zn-dependent oxidoreductase